jgi:nucleoside-diphosphate-sugar epimerase
MSVAGTSPAGDCHPLAGRRVLVTGASGFIGARLAERLVVECKATVRVTVRAVARAAALSRLPVEIAVADIRDASAVDAAVAGCSVVFHCARGIDGSLSDRRATDVDGTRNLVEAAIRHAAARFVHTSTFVVYDLPRTGDVDERTPRAGGGDPYADAKRAGEELVLAQVQRLPATVVQPTVVYGPFAGVYGRDILEELSSSRIPLIDGGAGICNAVYVDDVVSAMLLAATSDRAVGEAFLISGPGYPTWAQFYGEFERMLGVHRTVAISEREAIAQWKRSSRRPWLLPTAVRAVRSERDLRAELLATREGVVIRRVAERVLPPSFFAPERWVARRLEAHDPLAEPPLAAFKPQLVRFLASTARVRTDKARGLLGFTPSFGLADGMRLTEAWARWEGLLPAEAP